METSYQKNRNGKVKVIPEKTAGPTGSEQPAPGGFKVNGFQQVLDLLRAADPDFRQSLLKRMAQQDPQLVMNLKRALAE